MAADMAIINLFSATTGLNTLLDPRRIPYDAEAGVTALSKAVNMVIDDTGRLTSRRGIKTAVARLAHSVFCGGDAYPVLFAEDKDGSQSLYMASRGSDGVWSQSGLRSGLTAGHGLTYVPTVFNGYRVTLYSNGVENGMVANGRSYPWPTTEYKGPETTASFVQLPATHEMDIYNGRLFFAVGNVLFWALPFNVGLCDPGNEGIMFGSAINMIKPVQDGIFVSDDEATYFLAGQGPENFAMRKVAEYPASPGGKAFNYLVAEEIGFEQQGMVAAWQSRRGLCLGGPGGFFRNVTSRKIAGEWLGRGAAVVVGHDVIHSAGDITLHTNLSVDGGAATQISSEENNSITELYHGEGDIYAFNSLCNAHGKVLGANDYVLYEMFAPDGEADDKDVFAAGTGSLYTDGLPITWSVEFTINPVGTDAFKQMRMMYLTGAFDGYALAEGGFFYNKIFLEVYADVDSSLGLRVYEAVLPDEQGIATGEKKQGRIAIPIGFDHQGTHWRFRLYSTCKIAIDSITALVLRQHPGKTQKHT